jgi:hypothetical protein
MPLDNAGEPTMTYCMRFGAEPWEGTVLPLPEGWAGGRWHDAVTSVAMQAAGRELGIFADLRVAAPTAK